MIPILAAFVFLFITQMSLRAYNPDDIITCSLDQPLWALSLDGASDWLLPKKEDPKKVLIFCFSAEQKGTPEEGRTQKEDDIGRTTRSLPLYLCERINLETPMQALNLMPVLKGTGPVVAGKRNDSRELVNVMPDKPHFLISGHFQTDYVGLQKKLTVYIYDTKADTETKLVEVSSFFDSPSDIGSTAANQILDELGKIDAFTFTTPPKGFSRPPAKFTKEYLDGLGQLFVQTLVQNEYAPANSLWGEDRMLGWYQNLQDVMPSSHSPRLMILRGILASHGYGTDAHKPLIEPYTNHLVSLTDLNDPVNRLSPLFFHEIGDKKNLDTKVNELRNVKNSEYQSWLEELLKDK